MRRRRLQFRLFLFCLTAFSFAALIGIVRAQNAPSPATPATNPQAPVPIRPGQPAIPGTIRSTLDLVQVDVVVTGRDGKPVKDLKQEQFSVMEDGREQKISSFDYFDVEKVETAARGDAVAPVVIPLGGAVQPEVVREQVRDHRLMVMFFDLTSLQPPDLERATSAAHKFVREQMTPADLVGVVVFGNQLEVVTDFTSDRDLLDRAVDALRPGKEAELAELAADTAAANGDTSTAD